MLKLLMVVVVIACSVARTNAQCDGQWLPGAPGSDLRNVVASTYWDPDGPGPLLPRVATVGNLSTGGNTGLTNVGPVAFWNGTRWEPIPGCPLSGASAVVAMTNGDLLVAGAMTSIDYRVVRWNGAQWSNVGDSFDGIIRGMTRQGDAPIVCGDFTACGDILTKRIARFNGTAWVGVGGGLGNNGDRVYAVAATPSGSIVAGGSFFRAGTINVSFVASYNGSSWSDMGQGVGGYVYAIAALADGRVVVGGALSTAGGAPASAIAVWDGQSWDAMSGGMGSAPRMVNALAVLGNGDLIAGGEFSSAGGTPMNNIARWSGGAWSALGAYTNSNSVSGLCAMSGSDFAAFGGGHALYRSAARWSGGRWRAFGTEFDYPVTAIGVGANGRCYVGGQFNVAGGEEAHGVACWNGAAWTSLGTGFEHNGQPSDVRKTAVLPSGAVAVGATGRVGGTTAPGGQYVNSVYVRGLAFWDGVHWTDSNGLVTGNISSWIGALAVRSNGHLVVGGYIGNGDHQAKEYDGASWSSLGYYYGSEALLSTSGNGLIGACAWCVPDDQLGARPGVAEWNGISWAPLGGYFGWFEAPASERGSIRALARMPNGDIIAAGRFDRAGGVPANSIARWNGQSWSALGQGMIALYTGGQQPGSIEALAVLPNGDLVAGGYFTQAGGAPVNSIARWNGQQWLPMGAGIRNPAGDVWPGIVQALAVLSNGNLAVGGSFARAGDYDSPYFAIYQPGCSCPVDFDDDGDVSNGLTRDDAVTIDDMLAFLIGFESGNVLFDLDNDGDPAVGVPDGAVDINDLLFFLAHFEAGC